MSSRSKPFNSWLHRGLEGGAVALPFEPPGWPRPGGHFLHGPTPPHAALALHTNSPCECSFHHHRLPQLKWGGLEWCPSRGRQPPADTAWDGPSSELDSWY